ncbi:MAG: aspartate 1-decarboxylase [Planctomycetota bacterium]
MKVVRAKLHGIRVTGADLNYHGSITLDPEQCDVAGIYPMEFVDIWNKASGARLSTYVIYGEPGSRCCVLNGAAARTCQKGDELIVCSAQDIGAEELYKTRPRILTFLPDNTLDQVLQYEVFKSEKRAFDFRIVDASTGASEEECHTYPNVDIAAIRTDLTDRGWGEAEIEKFCERFFAL